MLARRITLRDVAERAGVHTSTASRAINEHTRSLVDDDTVARILEAAQELGYRPNSLARGLKTNRTFTVGMLLPDLTNPLFPPIVRGIEDGLGAADYTVILANTDNDEEKERAVLNALLNRQVDGMILATAQLQPTAGVREVIATGLPVVLVNRSLDDAAIPSVMGDDHRGIGLAVEHLARLGHRVIGHVAGPQHLSTGLSRQHSFRTSVRRAGLPADPDLMVVADSFREHEGAAAFATLLERRPDVTGVVAANDLIAVGCYDVISERFLRVGDDISVVGYNDMLLADKLCPPLTTIRIPHYEIGAKAAEIVLDLINGRTPSDLQVRLEPRLVERASTAPPRASSFV